MVTGQLDADKGDYLLRDSIHTGVSYGKYDLERILVTLTLVRDEHENPVVGIEEGGWHAAEGLIIARYMMFTQVYFHHVRRAYDHHIGRSLAFGLANHQGGGTEPAGCFPAPTSVDNLNQYLEWDDWRHLGLIQQRTAGPHGVIIKDRVHHRAVFSTPEVPVLEDLELLENVVDGLGSMVEFVDSAEKSWYAIGDRDLQIRPSNSEYGRPLSEFSSVIKGLSPVNQQRIYVSLENQDNALAIVRNLH